MIAGAVCFLADFLNLPFALLREAGLVLIPYVAFVAFVGTRETISRAGRKGDHRAQRAVGRGQHRPADRADTSRRPCSATHS